jgi:hypothetical protein
MHQSGLIHNPRSRRNRRLAVRLPSGLLSASPTNDSELMASLREFAHREVDLLMISGGDGTLRDIVTALPRAYGDVPLPAIALIAAGNSNLVACDVGACPSQREGLSRLTESAANGHWRRDVLRHAIAIDRGADHPILGFFMGAAALTRATQYNHDHVTSGGGFAVALTIGVALSRAVRGVGDWALGDWMSLSVDGAAPRDGQRFLFLASTLQSLMLGLWPFWGSSGPIRYLDVDAPPHHLGRSLIPLWRGKPTPEMLETSYHSSGAHSDLLITMDAPLTIDGEAFTSLNGQFALSLGPALRFVSP